MYMKHKLYIQCRAANGRYLPPNAPQTLLQQTGTFIADDNGSLDSPVFISMVEMCQWCRDNGWRYCGTHDGQLCYVKQDALVHKTLKQPIY
jgi:hypothetical protein